MYPLLLDRYLKHCLLAKYFSYFELALSITTIYQLLLANYSKHMSLFLLALSV